MAITAFQLARSIDQTNLNPNATECEISTFVESARVYNFFSVAIMLSWIPIATQILKGSQTTVVAPIGFPLGTYTTHSKVTETEWAIAHGPQDIEIDMTMNVSSLKSGHYDLVEKDIQSVVETARAYTVKVIIEVPLLTPQEIAIASLISEAAGAKFIKTSTGYKHLTGWRPSTTEDIRLIKKVVSDRLKIKVAGGINTLSQALASLHAGASRIGTSSGKAIIDTYRNYSNIRG